LVRVVGRKLLSVQIGLRRAAHKFRRAVLGSVGFCIEAFGRFHAAENAPLVRRIHPALAGD